MEKMNTEDGTPAYRMAGYTLYGLIPILPTRLYKRNDTWVFICEANDFMINHHAEHPWGKWSDYGFTVTPYV